MSGQNAAWSMMQFIGWEAPERNESKPIQLYKNVLAKKVIRSLAKLCIMVFVRGEYIGFQLLLDGVLAGATLSLARPTNHIEG